MQIKDGNKVLISAASRILTPAEKNYGVVEREALAVVYGINYFWAYLFGRPFVVITEHQCLKHIQSFKNSNEQIVRWLLALQEYRFEVVYWSGKENAVADALSCLDNSDNAQVNILQSEIIQ